ncbi:nudix-type nucleoside diphosphatase [Campylobacter pinnipediorum subsp. caledonicus]|uniref:Nudix-type nucleoside diphosphatase n=1 Tax=Campylobacter pinnipediorum subsp. caledonicus TaxID=1874362 RepID=A0A1S6U5Q4_9BACT|nr:NUDIX hydrolase [Campylobacter pinnipediorum]AQW87064.1 nudix-type nucleoside diphosphatase [Campylobacter pinnipediorum subsp. caledonicus]OPA72678.1 NUDIX hydrolase [Campylobacter pinnipediorum subsp. caledonicus]
MDTHITELNILPLGESKYLKPFKMEFKQNGKLRDWDCVKAFNSVSILLYHVEKDAFLFVKQFRPAVWYSQEKENIKSKEQGFTYELCAGIMDKSKTEEQTIREECIEEVGYDIKDVFRITMCYSALGFGGATQTMFYAQIDESMKISDGGGIDDESIELVFISRDKIDEFLYDESKVKGFGMLFAISWWKDKINKGLK